MGLRSIHQPHFKRRYYIYVYLGIAAVIVFIGLRESKWWLLAGLVLIALVLVRYFRVDWKFRKKSE